MILKEILDHEVNIGARTNEPTLNELIERYYFYWANTGLFSREVAQRYTDEYRMKLEDQFNDRR